MQIGVDAGLGAASRRNLNCNASEAERVAAPLPAFLNFDLTKSNGE
jgi:hypothetical protein